MSKRKPFILLMIAVVLGLLATTATARFVEKQGITGASGRMVLVAAEDLSAGTCITKESLREMPWPVKAIPASLVTESDDVLDWFVKSPIAAGEPLVRNKLSEISGTGEIAAYVPNGYRAMAIKVDMAVMAGGLLEPGSFVDLLTVVDKRGRKQVSKIILQNIKVLSVGMRKSDNGEEEKNSGAKNLKGSEEVVTLLLKPGEAEKLALAMNKGKIQVMARGSTDTDIAVTPGSSWERMIPSEQKPPPQPEPAPAAAQIPKEPHAAEELANRARTLEAKGELEAAREIYNQIVDEFADHRLAADAAKSADAITARIEQDRDEKKRLDKAEKLLAAAGDMLDSGLFNKCRETIKSIMKDCGSLTYKGEQIRDIVSGIELKANGREKRAKVDFQLFCNWLQNGNTDQAQAYLKKLQKNYPESKYYRDALSLWAKHKAAGEEIVEAPE